MPVSCQQSDRVLRTIDLFAGCGGLATGFEMASVPGGARFECVGAIDNWQPACDAFSLNHPVKATCTGVSEKSVGEILDRVGSVDVIAGGPPCQGFSTSGKRALDDPRNSLVKAYFGAVALAKPRVFLMENVSGFTTFQDGAIMREVLDLARELGYKPYPGIVLASLCGVPQRRRRFILVGVREGTFEFPNQRHASADCHGGFLFEDSAVDSGSNSLVVDQRPSDGTEQWTFMDATCDLPAIDAGEESTGYASAPTNAYQAWAREGAPDSLADHVACGHREYFVKMMSFIPQGRSAMDPEIQALMPVELRPQSGFPNSYARIRGDEPSPTITRNFTTPSSANCIHPLRNRSLTLREGARCQSFPDRYRFAGSHGDRRLMIGNAVPPLLARALGVQILRCLTGAKGSDVPTLAGSAS
ncbi:MAG: DNA cytosine methyltransferase [Phycisphaerae bacterium]|nr:DNA cytosine methyltransferase [Phycisphaerae bacterium]